MNVRDGLGVTQSGSHTVDVVIVGSGPAGAAVAVQTANAGLSTLVIEEGPWLQPADYPSDGFTAMAKLYRDMGASVTRGRSPLPYLQGRAVGGTSVVNGAISWRLPRDVHATWTAADPALAEAWPWHTLDQIFADLERDLHIAPTDAAIAGANNKLFAKGAEALGIAHRPIARNVRACLGAGQCLQGCPHGRKQSMDQSLLPRACHDGAQIWSNTKVNQIAHANGRATGVTATTRGGATVHVRATKAVVLAASAVQTPCLLWQSGLRHGPVGQGFQAHPGASVAGFFAQEVALWSGATQGHEAIGMRDQGLKFEALGMDIGLAASRLPGVGAALAHDLQRLPHLAEWGCAVKAQARGLVRPGLFGRPVVRYQLTPADIATTRKGIAVLAEMMLAAGAESVHPGVHGGPHHISSGRDLGDFVANGPADPRSYAMVLTHMFGTARAGSDPASSVVRPDFRHHHIAGLYVADSSVFPSNTGVNPQTSILALATLCGRSVVAA